MLTEKATWPRISPTDHLSPLQAERPALPGGPPYWSRIAKLDPLARDAVANGRDDRASGGQGGARSNRSERWLRRTAQPAGAVGGGRRGGALPGGPAGQAAADAPRPGPGALGGASCSSSGIPISRRTTTATSSTRGSCPAAAYAFWRSRVAAVGWSRQHARLTTLFDASAGIARDAMADFDAARSISPIGRRPARWPARSPIGT